MDVVGRLPVSTSCVTISNAYSLSSHEGVVHPGIKKLKRKKKTLIMVELDVRKPSASFLSIFVSHVHDCWLT